MTFCAGFISQGSVYLVADSAVTSAGRRATNQFSMFGQLQERSGVSVEEATVKLRPICDGLLTAFSGELGNINECVNFLKQSAGYGLRPDEVLHSFMTSTPWRNDTPVFILFAFSDRHGELSLVGWSNNDPAQLVPAPEMVVSLSLCESVWRSDERSRDGNRRRGKASGTQNLKRPE